MPFGQPESIEAEINASYEGQEILKRMVPPGVHALEEEYKKEVSDIMGKAFDISKGSDSVQVQFLAKYNLPAALHAVSGEQVIPEDLWQKIKQCKERGGINGLNQLLGNVAAMGDNNNNTLQRLFGQLQQEEGEDQAMRSKYGSAWSRLPSNSLNQNMLSQLNYYKQKYDQGRLADAKVKELIESKKAILQMLEIDRDGLTAKIPKSPAATVQMSPAAAKYFFITIFRLTDLMRQLDELKGTSDSQTEGLIKSFEAESVTSEMTQIYQKIKDKRTVKYNIISRPLMN